MVGVTCARFAVRTGLVLSFAEGLMPVTRGRNKDLNVSGQVMPVGLRFRTRFTVYITTRFISHHALVQECTKVNCDVATKHQWHHLASTATMKCLDTTNQVHLWKDNLMICTGK